MSPVAVCASTNTEFPGQLLPGKSVQPLHPSAVRERQRTDRRAETNVLFEVVVSVRVVIKLPNAMFASVVGTTRSKDKWYGW